MWQMIQSCLYNETTKNIPRALLVGEHINLYLPGPHLYSLEQYYIHKRGNLPEFCVMLVNSQGCGNP